MTDRIYVINLARRTDRRREILAELGRIGLSASDSKVEIFAAGAPDDPGPFPSIGARGCFLSHLGVLKSARDAGVDRLMILEDDATFTRNFVRNHLQVLAELDDLEWGVAYLGYSFPARDMPTECDGGSKFWAELPPSVGVVTAHAIVFDARTVAPLIDYLEAILARPEGSPEGGPMHVDGAYSWFRAAHPDIRTLVTHVPYIGQRSSRSDISAGGFKERLPFLPMLRRISNAIRRR